MTFEVWTSINNEIHCWLINSLTTSKGSLCHWCLQSENGQNYFDCSPSWDSHICKSMFHEFFLTFSTFLHIILQTTEFMPVSSFLIEEKCSFLWDWFELMPSFCNTTYKTQRKPMRPGIKPITTTTANPTLSYRLSTIRSFRTKTNDSSSYISLRIPVNPPIKELLLKIMRYPTRKRP